MNFTIIIYIVIGVLPSLAWLWYYLNKDLHPEPKKTILRIFIWGGLITLPVFFVQLGLTRLLDYTSLGQPYRDIIYWFLVISFSEEFFKYLVIRAKFINSPDVDEPLDIMLYMTVAALGFAAVENVLYLLPTINQMPFSKTLLLDLVRSVSAVFLHALCSAVVGYSLAISICEKRKKRTYVAIGILIATLLHGLFDFSIMTLPGSDINIIVPAIIVLALAFIVFYGFEKLKKMKSICKIN